MFPGLNNQCSVTEDITIDCVLYLLWQSERTVQLISPPSEWEVSKASRTSGSRNQQSFSGNLLQSAALVLQGLISRSRLIGSAFAIT